MRPGESFEQTIAIDGVARHYRLNIPSAASPGQRLPVVLNFHGRGSDAATQLGYSGFSRVSERQQFLLVTPDGSGAPRAWSAGATPPGDVDDVRFVASLLERLDAELCVDRDRVYAVGFSNGGFFAALLGCKLSDRITAVAAVGGAQRPTAGCGGAVPFLAIHGTADSIVPFGGGTIRGRYPYPGARATNADWAIANGCGGTPVLERVSAHVVRETVRGCVAPVLLYVVDGGGHTWPGASDIPGLGPTTLELNAAEVIWAFFSGAKSAR